MLGNDQQESSLRCPLPRELLAVTSAFLVSLRPGTDLLPDFIYP